MANQETQLIDNLMAKTRRRMLTLGTSALAGMAIAGTRTAEAQTTYTDLDILNFALNLEYLEANFYYLATFGVTIDKATSAMNGSGPITITGPVGTAGTVTVKPNPKVPFSTITVASYALETAIEEGKHVIALQGAIGSSAYVAQPAIDLVNSFNTLASVATGGVMTTFDPFANDAFFLIGAYIFEDVGVTAYHGAAPLITNKTGVLPTAAGILAVEAYHAGLVRTTIATVDNGVTFPTIPAGTLTTLTNQISTTRATLAKAAASATANPLDTNPDDFGLAPFSVMLGGSTSAVTATRLVDADSTNVVAFSRTTTQVLNIVTGGGAINGSAVVSPAKGVFFPAGLNGLFK